MITSSFSSVSRCNSLKTENFLSLSHYLFFLSIRDSVSQAQQHQQEAELQLVAATVNIQHDPGPLHLASDHNLQIFFTQMLCYFSGEPGLTSGPLIHFFLMMMVLVLLNITHYVSLCLIICLLL